MTDPAAILDLPIEPNDTAATTVKEYLHELLRTLWIEEQGFDGKRPFGNSGWQYDLYIPLMKAGLIDGKLDEYGYVETMDTEAGDKLIIGAIAEMFA